MNEWLCEGRKSSWLLSGCVWVHLADPHLHSSPPLRPHTPRHRELQLCVLVPCLHQLLCLLGQGLCPELKPVRLQSPAHCRLRVQLQILLFLVKHGPVGETLAIGVPVDIPSQQGGGRVTLSPAEPRPGTPTGVSRGTKQARWAWGMTGGRF